MLSSLFLVRPFFTFHVNISNLYKNFSIKIMNKANFVKIKLLFKYYLKTSKLFELFVQFVD